MRTLFPAGTGAGSTRKISGWTQLLQILEVASSGGEQQYETYQFLEADNQEEIATTKTPSRITLTIADDATLPGYQLLKVANDDRAVRASLLTKSSGAKDLFNHTITIGTVASLNTNKVSTVQATLALKGQPVRYTT